MGEITVSDGVLVTLIFGAFGYTFLTARMSSGKIDKKAEKSDIDKLDKKADYITQRVDKIYDHLLNGKAKEK
jgi:hypothetical protein